MKTKQIILEINDYSDLNKEELESKLMERTIYEINVRVK